MAKRKTKPTAEVSFPNRLREWRERRRFTLEQVGEKTNMGITKLHRLEVGARRLKVDDAEKIATVLGVPPHALLLDAADSKAPLELVMVTQKAHAGVWLENADTDSTEWQVLTVPKMKNPDGNPRYGVIVSDDSMDIVYAPGSVVIASPLNGRTPNSGQRVIVRRTRGDGRVELTVREYEARPDGRILLWPRSTRPEYQQPGTLGAQGDVTTQIDALVVGSYRFEE